MNNQVFTAYNGNPNLKPAYTQIAFTQEQVVEFIKCKNDPLYFIKTFTKIINVDDGLIPFTPYSYQEDIVNLIQNNRYVICKLPRQSGKSTILAAYIVWLLIFNENFSILIGANKAASAREIMKRIKTAYEYLPKWLQQGVLKWNEGSIELDNGSRVMATATASDSARGSSFSLVMLDEFAFVPDNTADEFFQSVYPTITSGKKTKLIIISTPNGLNHFYKMFTDAQKGRNNFAHKVINWYDVPGRDEKFREEQIRNIGEEKWNQEFVCEFLGSSNTLISGNKLQNLVYKDPIESYQGVKIYEKPVKGNTYMMTADVCQGKGLDYHAFCVFDITNYPFRLVASYHDNMLDNLLYPNIIHHIGRAYNDAYVLVEINDCGAQIADILYDDLEYENLLGAETKGRMGQVLNIYNRKGKGLKVSRVTKRVGCANLKTLIENDKLLVPCYDVIHELSNFIMVNGTYKADIGKHDDLAMCLVNFSWATTQNYFRDLVTGSVRDSFQDRIKQIEDDLVPFGAITGFDEDDEFKF